MANNTVFLILFFSLLQYACNKQKKQQSIFDFTPPAVVDAKGYAVPQDKMAPPEITPVKEIKSKAASLPKRTLLKSTVYPVAKPKRVAAGAPKTCTPGLGGYALPKVAQAIDSPFTAGAPEVTMAKDPEMRDNNPASFSAFKVREGLKSNMIFPVIQDRAGNLWIACFEGGVSKYDGRSFTNYTAAQGLSSDNVWSMLEDRKGNLWFGHIDGGVNKFDGKSLTCYKTGQGLSNDTVISMLEDSKGNIWFGTESGGVNKYDGKTFTQYTTSQGLPGNKITSIIEDSKGNLWFGTQGGLSKYDGRSFWNYTTEQGLSHAAIVSLLEDRKDNLWIRTFGGSVDKYDGRVFEQYSMGQSLSGNSVDKILEDRSGNLWFTLYGEGAIKFDGRSFTQFSFEQGVNDNKVHSIMEDKNGNLWLGTNDGLCRYNGKRFTHFNSSLGLSEGNYNSICEDKDGTIWVGIYGSGVDGFDGRSVTQYTTDQGLSNNSVQSVLKDSKGNLWVGTQGGGVNKYDGRSFSQFENLPPQTSVWHLLEDKKGNIWLGTSNGLYRYDGKNLAHFGTAQGLSWPSISCIYEDRSGNLWLGTEYDGVVNKLDLSAAAEGRYSITHYNINRGTSVSRVYSIQEDKNNNLWFGINGEGVIKFDGEFFTRYTTAQGLSSNSVNSMVEDKDGYLWFLTINGLCSMKPNTNGKGEKANPDHTPISLFTTYSYPDGFLGVGSHLNSMILARDGSIWTGSGNRLTCYHPEGDIPDTIPPTIQLNGVALFDETINWLELESRKDTTLVLGNGTLLRNFHFSGLTPWHNQPEHLQLAHNNNYITFQFVGITTNRPKQVRYKYFLEGLDKNWSSITDKPEATYSDLPSGKYTFKVKAVNSEGFWSKELAYSLTIFPPWWKTWWFRMVSVICALVLIYALMRWRLHQKFRLQLERSEKDKQLADLRHKTSELEMQALRAQMNPHFIFNCLNAINLFILKNDTEAASDYLTKFSRLIRLVLQSSALPHITLAEELETLRLYIELERVRFNKHFDYRISCGEEVEEETLLLPPMLLQPFVENAIWHGLMHRKEAGRLSIGIRQDGAGLCCTIEDNGIGRRLAAELKSKSAAYKKSMGMQITASRLQLLDGKEALEIIDLQDDHGTPLGTRVVVRIPVKESEPISA